MFLGVLVFYLGVVILKNIGDDIIVEMRLGVIDRIEKEILFLLSYVF